VRLIGRILVLLTPTPPGGHDEPLMQRFFGDWYEYFGRCPA
jgi:hypothetical protein